jgi:fatty-acyl-CoA synthase
MDRALTGAATDRSAHAVGLHEWLSRRSGRVPNRPALSCGDVRWSYGDLQQRIEAMSAVLAAGGVAAGDRVGYLGLNDPMFVVVMFATSRLGGVFVPLNFRLSGPELAWIIGDAGIHTLVAGEEHVPVIDGVRGSLSCKRFVHRAGGAPDWESADALMAHAASPPPAVPATADAVAVIMYTSGTTGHPKGAMLTHGNFWANTLNEMLLWDMVSTDVTLNFAPMFHVGGLLCGSLSTLLAGGHLVLQRAFDVAAVLRCPSRCCASMGRAAFQCTRAMA